MADTTPHTRSVKWQVIVPPVGLPVSSDEAEIHLRIAPGESAGGNLTLLIQAATDFAEDRLGMSLMPRTIRATFYAGEPLVLPRGPLIEVLSVEDADERPVADYRIVHHGNATRLTLPTAATYPISATYRAGYYDDPGDTSVDRYAVPPAIRMAILTHVATLYEYRESVADRQALPVPHSLEAFYALKSRKVGVG